eukprot:jgi/Mesen1/10073/ME000730S09344
MLSRDADVAGALAFYDRHIDGAAAAPGSGSFSFGQYHYNILLYLCASAASGTVFPRPDTRASAKAAKADRPLGSQEQEGDEGDGGGSGAQRAAAAAPAAQVTPGGGGGGQGEVAGVTQPAGAARGDNVPPAEAAAGASGQGTGEGQQEQGEMGEGVGVPVSAELQEEAKRRGFEVWEKMKERQVAPNEATFTSVARLAVAAGDGETAFALVKDMQAHGIAPKLRSYGPALFTFCQQGALERAMAVDAHMLEAGVQPLEEELAALLRLTAGAGTAAQVYALLHRLRATVCSLSATSVAAVEGWFSSDAAARAEGPCVAELPAGTVATALESRGGGWHGLGWLGRGTWQPRLTTVTPEGACVRCREQLITVDIDPEETERFAESLAQLAVERESRPNEFKLFQRIWVAVPQLIKGKGEYWLYAAVKCRALLVTNDEMRDHLFQLLGTDFFPKWKERHQVCACV